MRHELARRAQGISQRRCAVGGALILASGLHSPTYLQKALVFRDPVRMERLARGIVDALKSSGHGPFDIVVSPAVGAIIPGYEVARVLGLPAIYCERNKENQFAFGRGFELEPGARVLMVEDIVTTAFPRASAWTPSAPPGVSPSPRRASSTVLAARRTWASRSCRWHDWISQRTRRTSCRRS